MARLLVGVFVVAGLASSSLSAAEPPARMLEVRCAQADQRIQLPADGKLTLVSRAAGSTWVEVVERGYLLSVLAPDLGSAFSINVPYRYGRHWARLAHGQHWRIERTPPLTRIRASIDVRVHCPESADDVRHREWLAGLSSISAQLIRRLSAVEADALLARVEAPLARAATPTEHALALHAKAQTLMWASRTADSLPAFVEAEQAWLGAGDPARARVARVGRVEELRLLSRHDEAFAIAGEATASEAREDYFAARLRLSRCLGLRYQGRMAEALPCFRAGVADMQHLDETPDLVSALQDMADVSHYLGDRDAARQLGARALAQATLPGMEGTRGRIELMLGDIAVAQGDIGAALGHLDRALTEFAAAKGPRWEANALLRTADLYQSLGALEEATDFVSAALARLPERDAPARVAVARVIQARIDLRRGLVDRARRGLAAAIETNTRLAMPAELDGVQVAQARLFLQIGDRAAAATVVANRNRTQVLNQESWRLIEAGLLALQDQCGKAVAILAEFDGKPISIERELERVQIRAECRAAGGHYADAEKILAASADRIVALAQRIDSPLLRPVLAGYIAPLRRSAFRILARAGNGRIDDAAMVWHWLQRDEAALGSNRSGGGMASSQFDAEVARELLPAATTPPGGRDADAPRHLLSLLAASGVAATATPAAVKERSLADLQRRLGDAVFVSYVDAGTDSHLLWIRRDRVDLQRTADVNALREASDRLGASSSQRSSTLATVHADAARLSALLWPAPADSGAPPSRLLVDASGPLASLPWSVLNWPGQTAMLLETTQVTIARSAAADTPASPTSPDVAVYIAGQENNPALAPLWNARSEPALVERGVQGRGGKVSTVPATDREGLVSAFSRGRPWLHVAAHGGTLPSRIGYAGIWLESTKADQAPRFVSWLEILARGSSNELVVLNACQLAETQQGSAAGLNFADAVSRAGARDVVAARWQVSDGATTLWVPVFYQAMSEGAGAARALWQAQRRLHESRVYRHPFYWASYVHYGRI